MVAEKMKILLIGYGNPARADDGLGPALAEKLELKNLPFVTVEADYQLMIENSAQVAGHDIVIFADAQVHGPEPFSFEPVEAKCSDSFSTHSIEPAQIMALAESLFGSKAKGFILGIRGYEFDRFGAGLTEKAKTNLQKAADFLEGYVQRKTIDETSIATDKRNT
jgi:hydrogenase maturation protease